MTAAKAHVGPTRQGSRGTAVALMVISTLATVGCATRQPPLYHWEGYERRVYEYLKRDASTPNEQLLVLQEQSEKARANNAALPPGWRAHTGLLHLQLGRPDEARGMFEAEKAAFPESGAFMDLLLKGLNGGGATGIPNDPTAAPAAAPASPPASAAQS